MISFEEKYIQDKNERERNTNRRILWGLAALFLFLTIVWGFCAFDYYRINAKVFHIVYAVTALFWIPIVYIRRRCDLANEWVKAVFLLTVCVTSAAIGMMVTRYASLIYVLPLIFAVQYRDKKILGIIYVIDAVFMTVSFVLGYYYGICDLNLIIKDNHTRTWYFSQAVNGQFTAQLRENPLLHLVTDRVLPCLFVLAFFMVLLQSAAGSGKEDNYRISKLTYYREVDTVTRLYNKNKYEEMLSQYYPSVNEIAVILWDINNLKNVNDRLGHAAGDKLIGVLAGAIYDQTEEWRKAYRIGGDEFVMVVENPKEKEIDDVISGVKAALKKHGSEDGFSVSSAVGAAFGKGEEITRVAYKADENMYTDKKRGKKSREYAEFSAETEE